MQFWYPVEKLPDNQQLFILRPGGLRKWNFDFKVSVTLDLGLGKGSYNDNLFIERLWRTVKCEAVYLKACQDGRDAKTSLGNYFHFYNTERPHQTLGYKTPVEVFISTPVEVTNEDMIESLVPDPLGIA